MIHVKGLYADKHLICAFRQPDLTRLPRYVHFNAAFRVAPYAFPVDNAMIAWQCRVLLAEQPDIYRSSGVVDSMLRGNPII